MSGYDSILIKNIAFNFLISLLTLYVAFYFFKGVNLSNDTKIVTKNIIEKIFVTRIIPIVIVSLAIWFGGSPVVDFIIKDYRDSQGVLKTINVIRGNDELILESGHRYNLPKDMLPDPKMGELYKFRYAKRSKIILEINEVQ